MQAAGRVTVLFFYMYQDTSFLQSGGWRAICNRSRKEAFHATKNASRRRPYAGAQTGNLSLAVPLQIFHASPLQLTGKRSRPPSFLSPAEQGRTETGDKHKIGFSVVVPPRTYHIIFLLFAQPSGNGIVCLPPSRLINTNQGCMMYTEKKKGERENEEADTGRNRKTHQRGGDVA